MNTIDKFLSLFVRGRDAWKEARDVTRRLQNEVDDISTAAALQSMIPTEHGLVVDLNKYRPSRSLKKMMDAGVSGFILRMGGPLQWVEGDYKYTEDPTWRPYMDQAKALGIQNQIGGYIIHNPFEDWNLQGVTSNVHMNLINQWTGGGYMPGYLIVDHEINYCYRGATKIICTGPNLVNSLASVTDQIWKCFHKVPMIYTARWFVDQNDPTRHATFFDNINKVDRLRPTWFAWYPVILSKVYPTAGALLNEIATPTSTQIGKYCQCGSYSLASAVQFTDRAKFTGVMLDGSDDTTGCDGSYTWGTWADYCKAVGINSGTTPPEPPIDPDPTDLTLAALKAQVDLLQAAFEAHTHTTGKPA